jgi:hypothetical protein
MDEIKKKILQFGLDCMGYVGDKAIENLTKHKASAAFVEPQLAEIMALIASYSREARIEEWHKMVEFMKPPEMHPDFKWPCPFCGLSPIMIDNEHLKTLKEGK